MFLALFLLTHILCPGNIKVDKIPSQVYHVGRGDINTLKIYKYNTILKNSYNNCTWRILRRISEESSLGQVLITYVDLLGRVLSFS